MLKSSLEIYSPLKELEAGEIANLAQSNNAAVFVKNTSSGIVGVEGNGDGQLSVGTSDHTITLSASSPVDVRVVTADGKEVFSGKVDGSTNVSGLSSGLYLVNGRKVVLR